MSEPNIQNSELFSELFKLGLTPIPVIWDLNKKDAIRYPTHSNNGRQILSSDVHEWLNGDFRDANGMGLKLYPPYGMIDFDTKNTDRKDLYQQFFNIVESTNEEVLRKVCIEETRSGGNHVYIKYAKLEHKIPIARKDKKEVISLYTGGLLSFCAPTPGYKLIHNDFSDIQELSDNEYDLLISAAAYFNEDTDFTPGAATIQNCDYPEKYESVALQFDSRCTDDLFEYLLNSIELFEVKGKQRNKKYIPYLRKGSKANYSAKAYFGSKRLLIFSASMSNFPTWHDRIHEDDSRWSLSPTKILYYKNNRDWDPAINELNNLAKKFDVSITQPTPKATTTLADRLKFPFDIFPEKIQQYIFAQSIQHEYLAGALLGAISACIGNTAYLEAMPGYNVKAILYLAIVAPPGAAKTPAIKKIFGPVEKFDKDFYDVYKESLEEYELKLEEFERNKKKGKKPKPPTFSQILIKDATIEVVSHILNCNPLGCCILADELSGFLNRFNQYKSGDEEQKWLELWSGSSILNQRVSTGVKKIMDPFCSIVGGIQPGVLESLSKEERQHNGFYHRFLFVFPVPQQKLPWESIVIPSHIIQAFNKMFEMLLGYRIEDKMVYDMSPEATFLYKQWFDLKNVKYNKAQSDNEKGIIAKYQDYALRFALLIQVVDDGYQRRGIVSAKCMEKAIRLTEYFLGNMLKASKFLAPETPLDKLSEQHKNLYLALPQSFEIKTAVGIAEKFDIKDSALKMFVKRNVEKLFEKGSRNNYEKIY